MLMRTKLHLMCIFDVLEHLLSAIGTFNFSVWQQVIKLNTVLANAPQLNPYHPAHISA
jgi:hypothetical protein